jgi:hypothetical protein
MRARAATSQSDRTSGEAGQAGDAQSGREACRALRSYCQDKKVHEPNRKPNSGATWLTLALALAAAGAYVLL